MSTIIAEPRTTDPDAPQTAAHHWTSLYWWHSARLCHADRRPSHTALDADRLNLPFVFSDEIEDQTEESWLLEITEETAGGMFVWQGKRDTAAAARAHGAGRMIMFTGQTARQEVRTAANLYYWLSGINRDNAFTWEVREIATGAKWYAAVLFNDVVNSPC